MDLYSSPFVDPGPVEGVYTWKLAYERIKNWGGGACEYALTSRLQGMQVTKTKPLLAQHYLFPRHNKVSRSMYRSQELEHSFTVGAFTSTLSSAQARPIQSQATLEPQAWRSQNQALAVVPPFWSKPRGQGRPQPLTPGSPTTTYKVPRQAVRNPSIPVLCKSWDKAGRRERAPPIIKTAARGVQGSRFPRGRTFGRRAVRGRERRQVRPLSLG